MRLVLAIFAFFLVPLPAYAGTLKPFVLGNPVAEGAKSLRASLESNGFTVLGEYQPYDGATVLAFTDGDLEKAAAGSTHGGFAAVLRASVSGSGASAEVAWTDPLYLAAACRLSADLGAVRGRVATALGEKETFGARDGLTAEKLRKYHYMMGMEYFDSESENLLHEFSSHDEAIAAVEKGLAAGIDGTSKVYRLDIPGTEQTVFGVAMTKGDGADKHVMEVIDMGAHKATPYLPYEILVDGKKALHLFMRFRTAVLLPDLTMKTFMKLMSSPKATKRTLKDVVEGTPAK